MVKLVLITVILLVLTALVVGGFVMLDSMDDPFQRRGDGDSDIWPE